MYYEPACDCTCLHNVFTINASNQITAFVSIEIGSGPRVTLACLTFELINKCPNETVKSAFCCREKNSRREGGVEERYFRDCTGSHVVFPLEDPLLPGFCGSPAHALIWSLLRVALMLRHCWNYAAPSFSPPPPYPHCFCSLRVWLSSYGTAFTSNCLFIRTGHSAPAYYCSLKRAIVIRIQILYFYLLQYKTKCAY